MWHTWAWTLTCRCSSRSSLTWLRSSRSTLTCLRSSRSTLSTSGSIPLTSRFVCIFICIFLFTCNCLIFKTNIYLCVNGIELSSVDKVWFFILFRKCGISCYRWNTNCTKNRLWIKVIKIHSNGILKWWRVICNLIERQNIIAFWNIFLIIRN